MERPRLPIPTDDPEVAWFWEGARQGELRIMRCRSCGFYVHLPRPVCRNCGGFDVAPEAVSGRATLYSYTITYKAFHPLFVDRLPYVIATVELVEQPKLHLVSNLVGLDEADIAFGMDLVVGFEPLTDELTIPVFTRAAVAA